MPDIRDYRDRQAWAKDVLAGLRFGFARDEAGFYRPIRQVSPVPPARKKRPKGRETRQLELGFPSPAPASPNKEDERQASLF